VNGGQKGIRGIEAASRERNDGKFQLLQDVTSLTVHKECRRQYTHPDSIERAKRGSAEDTVGVKSSSLQQRLRKPEEAFDFYCQCLFCAEKIDIIGERRKEEVYRRIICGVENSNVQNNLLRTEGFLVKFYSGEAEQCNRPCCRRGSLP